MKRIFLILIILLSVLEAQFSGAKGQTYFNFLRLYPEPEVAALGKNAVALEQCPQNFVVNPAYLSDLESSFFSSAFYRMILGINLGSLTYFSKFKNNTPYAVSINYIDYGSIPSTDEFGASLGEVGVSDLAISFGTSRKLLPNLYAGLSLALVYSDLVDVSAVGIAGSFGLIYKTNDKGNFGLSLLNFGSHLSKYNSDDVAKMPTTIAAGWSKKLEHLPVRLSGTVSKSNGTDPFFHGGLLILFKPYLHGRIGFFTTLKSLSESETEIFSFKEQNKRGFTFGFNIQQSVFNFDFAVVPFAELGSMYLFGLNYYF